MAAFASTCASCGASFGPDAGAFCTYCGAQREVSGWRLAEAICIATVGDRAEPLLPYGTVLPASFTDVFSTGSDEQETIQIHLVSGNGETASGSRSLARLTFPLLTRGPTGVPRVQLTLRVEIDGQLSLTLEEEGTDNWYERADLLVGVIQPPGAGP